MKFLSFIYDTLKLKIHRSINIFPFHYIYIYSRYELISYYLIAFPIYRESNFEKKFYHNEIKFLDSKIKYNM